MWLDSSGSAQEPVASSCEYEYVNEASGSIEGGEFID
jgi:hypothetical protein